MSDLVGNPKDRFSHVAAHSILRHNLVWNLLEIELTRVSILENRIFFGICNFNVKHVSIYVNHPVSFCAEFMSCHVFDYVMSNISIHLC